MSDTPAPIETPLPSIGQTLRRRRLEKSITPEQSAQDTKIHIKFIRALEDERWADFPARVYMEGFLKRYAGYLGLEGEDMVKQLRKSNQEGEKPGFSSPVPREEDAENRAATPAAGSPLRFLLGGAAVVAALALAYVKMEEHRMALERPAPAPENLSAPAAPVEPPAPVNHDVSVSAKSPVWVRIWVDDQVKFEGILQAAQNKSWTALKKLRVMAGNAAVVAVRVDGRPVTPTPGGPAGEIHWVAEEPSAAPAPETAAPAAPAAQQQAAPAAAPRRAAPANNNVPLPATPSPDTKR